MVKTIAALAVALFVVLPVNSEETKAKAAFDPATVVGAWKITSGLRGGDKISDEGMKTKIVITKDTITLGTGDQKFVIGYTVDNKASPATIDMSIKEGPVSEGKAIGIVAADGEGFKLCYVVQESKDTKRPTKFESTKDNNAALFVLKPEKK